MQQIYNSWQSQTKNDHRENLRFLRKLRGSGELDTEVKQLHDEAFEQIDCLSCANCCKTTPAMVTKSDAKKIAAHLGIPPKTFIKKYLIEDIVGGYVFSRVPCVFLGEDHKCSIYEVRPQACRRYPHTDESGFGRRPKLNAANTVVCPAVYHIVEQLKSKHHDL